MRFHNLPAESVCERLAADFACFSPSRTTKEEKPKQNTQPHSQTSADQNKHLSNSEVILERLLLCTQCMPHRLFLYENRPISFCRKSNRFFDLQSKKSHCPNFSLTTVNICSKAAGSKIMSYKNTAASSVPLFSMAVCNETGALYFLHIIIIAYYACICSTFAYNVHVTEKHNRMSKSIRNSLSMRSACIKNIRFSNQHCYKCAKISQTLFFSSQFT